MPDYRIKQAADLLGVSDDTFRRWAEGGRITVRTDEAGRQVVSGVELAKLAQEVATAVPGMPDPGGSTHSTRNRFTGLVTKVIKTEVMAQVDVQAGPHRLVSLLSREAVDELGIEPGVLVVASTKATNISLELPR